MAKKFFDTDSSEKTVNVTTVGAIPPEIEDVPDELDPEGIQDKKINADKSLATTERWYRIIDKLIWINAGILAVILVNIDKLSLLDSAAILKIPLLARILVVIIVGVSSRILWRSFEDVLAGIYISYDHSIGKSKTPRDAINYTGKTLKIFRNLLILVTFLTAIIFLKDVIIFLFASLI